ncbi:hypothetical protein LXL04_027865 [Taraxacum kok-saghyz]
MFSSSYVSHLDFCLMYLMSCISETELAEERTEDHGTTFLSRDVLIEDLCAYVLIGSPRTDCIRCTQCECGLVWHGLSLAYDAGLRDLSWQSYMRTLRGDWRPVPRFQLRVLRRSTFVEVLRQKRARRPGHGRQKRTLTLVNYQANALDYMPLEMDNLGSYDLPLLRAFYRLIRSFTNDEPITHRVRFGSGIECPSNSICANDRCDGDDYCDDHSHIIGIGDELIYTMWSGLRLGNASKGVQTRAKMIVRVRIPSGGELPAQCNARSWGSVLSSAARALRQLQYPVMASPERMNDRVFISDLPARVWGSGSYFVRKSMAILDIYRNDSLGGSRMEFEKRQECHITQFHKIQPRVHGIAVIVDRLVKSAYRLKHVWVRSQAEENKRYSFTCVIHGEQKMYRHERAWQGDDFEDEVCFKQGRVIQPRPALSPATFLLRRPCQALTSDQQWSSKAAAGFLLRRSPACSWDVSEFSGSFVIFPAISAPLPATDFLHLQFPASIPSPPPSGDGCSDEPSTAAAAVGASRRQQGRHQRDLSGRSSSSSPPADIRRAPAILRRLPHCSIHVETELAEERTEDHGTTFLSRDVLIEDLCAYVLIGSPRTDCIRCTQCECGLVWHGLSLAYDAGLRDLSWQS